MRSNASVFLMSEVPLQAERGTPAGMFLMREVPLQAEQTDGDSLFGPSVPTRVAMRSNASVFEGDEEEGEEGEEGDEEEGKPEP